MSIDMLGDNPLNIITGEVIQSSPFIIPMRGFFFADTVTVYDGDGNEIDKNGYSFDLPIPDISGRLGRLVFGRIIMGSVRTPTTVDYRTPHTPDDNRHDEIVEFLASQDDDFSYYYYDNSSHLFKYTINKYDDANHDAWMDGLEYLIEMWRSRTVDYDILLHTADEVFTKGLMLNPPELDVESVEVSKFITTIEGGNSLILEPWSITWDVDGVVNTFDYLKVNAELNAKMGELTRMVADKYDGDITTLRDAVITRFDLDIEEAVPVTSIGNIASRDVSLVDGDFGFKGIDLPEYYVGLTNRLVALLTLSKEMINESFTISQYDIDEIEANMKILVPKLEGGYVNSDVIVGDNRTLTVLDDKCYNVLTKEYILTRLNSLNVTGVKASNDTLLSIDAKVKGIVDDTDYGGEIYSSFDSLGGDLANILDGLCVTKESVPHVIGVKVNITGVL